MFREIGCSGRFFRVSRKIFAGTATVPDSSESTGMDILAVVCKSEAVAVRLPSEISRRKFSSMGMTGLVDTTPEMSDRFFNN
jgi:hypothetical protein